MLPLKTYFSDKINFRDFDFLALCSGRPNFQGPPYEFLWETQSYFFAYVVLLTQPQLMSDYKVSTSIFKKFYEIGLTLETGDKAIDCQILS